MDMDAGLIFYFPSKQFEGIKVGKISHLNVQIVEDNVGEQHFLKSVEL